MCKIRNESPSFSKQVCEELRGWISANGIVTYRLANDSIYR